MGGSAQWPALSYEEAPWARDPDELALVPRSRRRKMTATYQAAIPLPLATRALAVPAPLEARMSEAVAMVSRFDEQQARAGFNLPATLLRSESAASSQIERLTASIRNIALAEVSLKAPRNAHLIAGNVFAMREALDLPDELTIEAIARIHEALMAPAGVSFGGAIRQEQVWIGGTPYSPHEALFVPPVASRVPGCLDDLVAFSRRDDLGPIAKAALLHAQFETIHPFIDGNGRTGRALLSKVLRHEGLLRHTTLPVSAGLLRNMSAYMDALDRYHEGDPLPIIEQVTDALELAVVIGAKASAAIGETVGRWRSSIVQRSSARIHEMPNLLVEQPVVDSAYVARRLGISQRAARDVLEQACGYGMVRPTGNAQRGVLYQADELLEVMEEVSSLDGLRRMLQS